MAGSAPQSSKIAIVVFGGCPFPPHTHSDFLFSLFTLCDEHSSRLSRWRHSPFLLRPPRRRQLPQAIPRRRHACNNLGAAYMNQQLFEKGLKSFQEAAALDPGLQIASLNQGVALLNLTRIDPAKALLEAAVKKSPGDPHAWFSLGLLYKNSDNPQGSVDAFRHVTEIDPNDADTWYFLGAALAQLKQYPQAIDAFQHALKLNPLHASAEFGIARSYQQSGNAAQAREHLVRFQHITQNKLGSPIGLAYGDQGRYSLVEEAVGAAEKALPQIPVRFVDVSAAAGLTATSHPAPNRTDTDMTLFRRLGPALVSWTTTATVAPTYSFRTMALKAAWSSTTTYGDGKFEDATRDAGLILPSTGSAAPLGDYDNDGTPDLAVSFNGPRAPVAQRKERYL